MKLSRYLFLAVALSLILPTPLFAQEELVLDIDFPVDGPHSFINDFTQSRGDHMHAATDILAEKMTPIVSVSDGVITFLPIPEPSWGYAIYIKGDDGYSYHYLHINNDTPGTDDGNGGLANAYAPGIERGARVTRGQLIGWVGDSGNAEWIASHLHFEIEDAQGNRVNPYFSLIGDNSSSNYDPEIERQLSQTINSDRLIDNSFGVKNCDSNTLIKSAQIDSVYYCGADGKRYVFPNQAIYNSWYENFDTVLTISTYQLASIPIGGNVTYKPGKKLIKIQSDPKVYAVSHGGILRWVQSEVLATAFYGDNWAKEIDDIQEVFFFNYEVGDPVSG